MTETGMAPSMDAVTREYFRQHLKRIGAKSSTKLQDRPQLVFSGGGYGSGKTTALNYLANCGALPVPMHCLVGADVFKQLIPEYNLIKAVADGRASVTVQKECVGLVNELFPILINNGMSFIMDSSMSDQAETMKRIELAKKLNYELHLVAIFTPLEVAIQQSMRRARISRRFPNAEALPKSHVGFRDVYKHYLDHFDEISLLANFGNSADNVVVAEKKDGKVLDVLRPDLFTSPLFVPLKA